MVIYVYMEQEDLLPCECGTAQCDLR